MQYRIDPKNGKQLSILGFGCMRFPSNAVGKIDEKTTEELILKALESGVNYFDTAYLYPGSEEMLGKIMARNGIRDRMLLATKLPHTSCRKTEDLDKYLDTSLKRLQTNHVEYYMVHNVTTFSQWERLLEMGVVDWVERMKKEGKIGSFGFSFHGSLDEFKKLIDAYDWDFTQIQYNYANEHYQAGVEGLRLATERNIPVFIMEPLLGGKLANNLPKQAQQLFVDDIVKKTGTTSDSVTASVRGAFRWLWNQPEVTMVLSGMNAHQQLDENLITANDSHAGMLREEDMQLYENVLDIFRESYRIPCTGCNYCMPCPKGINIPALFSTYNTSYSTGWFSGVLGYFTSCGALSHDPHYASDCIGCGKCTKHCPQAIPIPSELKKVRRRLQPPLGKAAMSVASKVRM